MPHGISALSTHPILFSQFRGPLLRLEATPPADPPKDPPAAPPKDPPADPKKEDTEGRITQLANDNKELKKQLKEFMDAKKAEEDEKAKKKGDYEKLIQERDAKVAELTGATEQAGKRLERFEANAKKQIDESLKGIADAERRKAAQKMLDGRSIEEQIDLLPEVLRLAGQSAASGFGNATPSSALTPDKATVDAKKKRYAELVGKGASVNPQEKSERYSLMKELEKVWAEEHKTK